MDFELAIIKSKIIHSMRMKGISYDDIYKRLGINKKKAKLLLSLNQKTEKEKFFLEQKDFLSN